MYIYDRSDHGSSQLLLPSKSAKLNWEWSWIGFPLPSSVSLYKHYVNKMVGICPEHSSFELISAQNWSFLLKYVLTPFLSYYWIQCLNLILYFLQLYHMFIYFFFCKHFCWMRKNENVIKQRLTYCWLFKLLFFACDEKNTLLIRISHLFLFVHSFHTHKLLHISFVFNISFEYSGLS